MLTYAANKLLLAIWIHSFIAQTLSWKWWLLNGLNRMWYLMYCLNTVRIHIFQGIFSRAQRACSLRLLSIWYPNSWFSAIISIFRTFTPLHPGITHFRLLLCDYLPDHHHSTVCGVLRPWKLLESRLFSLSTTALGRRPLHWHMTCEGEFEQASSPSTRALLERMLK